MGGATHLQPLYAIMARTESKLNFTLYLFDFVEGNIILIFILLKELRKKLVVVRWKSFYFSVPCFGSGETSCTNINTVYGHIKGGVGEFHIGLLHSEDRLC